MSVHSGVRKGSVRVRKIVRLDAPVTLHQPDSRKAIPACAQRCIMITGLFVGSASRDASLLMDSK